MRRPGSRSGLSWAGATDDAYDRRLGERLLMCEREDVDSLPRTAHVGVFVRELASLPSLRGAIVVAVGSGAGLATIQRRLMSRLARLPWILNSSGCAF